MTDYKALCAELLSEYEDSFVISEPSDDPLVQRARAALAAKAEPEPPCCEAWEDWLESVAWFTDIEDTCRMPHLQDVYHPFNYCPSCGTERRNTIVVEGN